MSRTRQQAQRQGQKRHQRAVERQRQKAERRRMPAQLDMSPEAQFRRSRWGQLIDLNKAGPYAMLKAYCGQFAEALDLLERSQEKAAGHANPAGHHERQAARGRLLAAAVA